MDDPKVKAVVKNDMGRLYGNWRNKCHQHYKKFKGGAISKENPPKEFEKRREDWRWICENIFEDPKWKERSTTNSRNRENLQYIHRQGSKSFAQKRHEKRDPQTNAKPGPIETFSMTYKDKNDCWSSPLVEQAHEQMMQRKNESVKEDGTLVNEEDICLDVFGKRSSYIVGRGRGPKPPRGKRSVSGVGSSANEVQETIQVQKEEIEAQKTQIEAQKLQIDSQIQLLESQRDQLEAQQAKIDSQQSQLDSQQSQIESQQSKVDWLMKHVMPMPLGY